MVGIYLGVAVLVIVVAFVVVPARELRRTLDVSRRPQRIPPHHDDEAGASTAAARAVTPVRPASSAPPVKTRQPRQPIVLRSMPAATTRTVVIADGELQTI